ncbi:sulfur oxidation c-type cytochrome SoxX [Microbaculum marinum]|uniref:Sulfur oxidation c-type cytochrome SoxX n=1 Tax=Microbaculum marinum TaxID=1764581 RepID=A0AAW9RM76_9HYPH
MPPRIGCLAVVGLLFGVSIASAEVVKPTAVVFEDMTVRTPLTGEPGDPAKGRVIFADRKLGNCLACHANADQAELFHGEVGPPLDGVADRYEPEMLRAIVVNPKEIFGDQTVMPAFYRIIEGQRIAEAYKGKTILSAEQVEDVVAYLSTLKE